jgi:hypothetical protein
MLLLTRALRRHLTPFSQEAYGRATDPTTRRRNAVAYEDGRVFEEGDEERGGDRPSEVGFEL